MLVAILKTNYTLDALAQKYFDSTNGNDPEFENFHEWLFDNQYYVFEEEDEQKY